MFFSFQVVTKVEEKAVSAVGERLRRPERREGGLMRLRCEKGAEMRESRDARPTNRTVTSIYETQFFKGLNLIFVCWDLFSVVFKLLCDFANKEWAHQQSSQI